MPHRVYHCQNVLVMSFLRCIVLELVCLLTLDKEVLYQACERLLCLLCFLQHSGWPSTGFGFLATSGLHVSYA